MHAAAVEALCTTNKPASCTPDRLLEIKKFADYWSNPTTTKVEPQTAGALLQELLFHAQSLQGELNLYRAGDGKYNVDVQRGINFALDAVLKIGRRAISGGAIIISDGELDGIRNGENL
jgi:hypothetical protein